MISVCMATFNGSKYIEEQMKSILNQSLKPDEVIIHDDKSTDDTIILINNFIFNNKLEDKWKLVINEQNLGYPSNFYTSIINCKGDIIFLSDQDDIWEIDKIKSMVQIMNDNSMIQLLSCRHEIINEHGEIIGSIMAPRSRTNEKLIKIDTNTVLKSFEWPGMTMAFRNSFFREKCIDLVNTQIPHDFGLAFLASNSEAFYFYNQLGAYHRRHNSNTGLSEHKISKLLRMKRKLRDLKLYNRMLENTINCNFAITDETSKLLFDRFSLSMLRYRLLNERDKIGIVKYYISNMGRLRIKSMIADLLIVFFDKNKEREGECYD